MKILISTIVGIIIGYLLFFQLDPWIVSKIMETIPETDYKAFIKLCTWIILIIFTGGLNLWISISCMTIIHRILVI